MVAAKDACLLEVPVLRGGHRKGVINPAWASTRAPWYHQRVLPVHAHAED